MNSVSRKSPKEEQSGGSYRNRYVFRVPDSDFEGEVRKENNHEFV